MLSLLAIVLNAITITIAQAEILKCPSKEYVLCANYGNVCRISDSVVGGYISFGTTDKWSLHVFKHYGSNANFKIDCKIEQFRDIDPSVENTKKYCCYLKADSFDATGFSSGWPWVHSSQYYDIPITRSLIYSISDVKAPSYLYDVIGKPVGRIMPEKIKSVFTNAYQHYYASTSVPTSITTAEWTICASQELLSFAGAEAGGYCSGFVSGFTYWIKFGEDDRFHYKLVTVVGNDVSIKCDLDVFGNAFPGTLKYCYRSGPIYSFGGIISGWKKIYSCIGCASIEKAITVGISQSKEASQSNDVSQSYEMSNSIENSISHHWEVGLEATVETGILFAGVSVTASASGGGEYSNTNSYTMTGAKAQSVAYGIINTIAESKEETISIICKEDVLWQFVTSITQNNGLSSQRFSVQTDDWECLPEGTEPKCPPGFCSDSLCQTCNQASDEAHTPPISWINKYHKPKTSINTKPINNDKYFRIEAFTFVLVSIVIITINILCCKKYMKYKQQHSRKSIPIWIEPY
eukprot:491933_1